MKRPLHQLVFDLDQGQLRNEGVGFDVRRNKGGFVNVYAFDTRGQVMERHPRPVDIEVERRTGESYQGRDTQLERAVEELLRQLGLRATTSQRSPTG